MQAGALEGAFADPPQEAARAFRSLLDAMARPGEVRQLAGARPPAGVSAAAGTALLVLCDTDTAIWLPERLATGPLADWIAFHMGAPLTAERGEADFALGFWGELAPLTDWKVGSPDYPDRSTTLIVEVDALEGGPPLRLSGPGIPGERVFAPHLPSEAAFQLAANRRRFPLGVDLVFAAGEAIAALPRSTAIGV